MDVYSVISLSLYLSLSLYIYIYICKSLSLYIYYILYIYIYIQRRQKGSLRTLTSLYSVQREPHFWTPKTIIIITPKTARAPFLDT